MDIYQIIAVGLAGAILSMTVKQYKPELAMLVGLATGILIFFASLDTVRSAFAAMDTILEGSGLDRRYFQIVLKIVGVAYITQFAAQLCRDSGENSIALKLEFAGKVFILLFIMPVITGFLQVCIEAISHI
jgi:stage III sporulation protein AD